MFSFNPVLAQFLPQGGAMDPQDLGGRGAVVAAFFEKSSEDRGFGELEELLVDGCGARFGLLAKGSPGPLGE